MQGLGCKRVTGGDTNREDMSTLDNSVAATDTITHSDSYDIKISRVGA